jgi:hypothetical protein
MDPDPTCSRKVPLQIFLFPEISTQGPLVCIDMRTQSLWEASQAVWTKCSLAPWLGCIPRSWATARQPGRQKCQLWSLLFPANAPEMLQETLWGKQSHWDHFYRKQGVYYATGLRGDNFSKPWALICVRSLVKYLQSLPFIPPHYLTLLVCGYSCQKGRTSIHSYETTKQLLVM